jgi:hypothetical protein
LFFLPSREVSAQAHGGKRQADGVKAEKFGDLITADHS